MEPIPCVNCGTFFIPRNCKQNYCKKAGCQRARKAAWQRYKMKYDDDYRTQQHLSQQKWLQTNPGYYRSYRRRNPDKVQRNRSLQTIRNRRNRQHFSRKKLADNPLIAKMEEKIRRQLRKGQKKELRLKQNVNANRVGLWVFQTAKKNLERYNEISFNKKSKKWKLLS